MAAFTGLVDGLVRRDARLRRRARIDFVYHRARASLMPLAVLPWVTYLALPISVHPLLILLPSAALLGVAVASRRRRSRNTCSRICRPRKAVAGRFRLIAAPEDRPFEHRATRIPRRTAR